MTKLYIKEFIGLASVNADGAVLAFSASDSPTDQVVDFTAGVAPSNAFTKGTTWVLLSADSVCSIAFGAAPVATVNNWRLPANVPTAFLVPANGTYKISAISNP